MALANMLVTPRDTRVPIVEIGAFDTQALESLWPLSKTAVWDVAVSDLKCFTSPDEVTKLVKDAEYRMVSVRERNNFDVISPVGFIAISGMDDEPDEAPGRAATIDFYGLTDHRSSQVDFFAQLGICQQLFKIKDMELIEMVAEDSQRNTDRLSSLGFIPVSRIDTNVMRGMMRPSRDVQWQLLNPASPVDPEFMGSDLGQKFKLGQERYIEQVETTAFFLQI